jgi:predicted MFS family arabinose efflux permease
LAELTRDPVRRERLRPAARASRPRSLVGVALGGDIDRRVASVAAVALAYSASFSTFWVYVGVYAVKGLGWPAARVGILFLLSAPAAAVANYLSGRISDRVSRKQLIIGSFLASAANVAALSVLGHAAPFAFALIVLQGVIGAPAYSLDRVLVADLVPEREGRERAYATVRVATNFGAFIGPPVAAVLIFVGGWTTFLLGISAVGILGAALATAFLPETGGALREAELERRPLRVVAQDRAFVLLLLSTLLAFTVYCGFETVLPVIAVTDYGVAPATWGVLVAISPLLVVFGQLRITRFGARLRPGARLGAAIVVMGLPFLALVASGRTAVIAGVIVVFVLGEMLWMPTSQAVAAQLAPARLRGTYFGALAAMTGPAWTLAPLIALQLRAAAGVRAVWILFAGVALAGAAAGIAALGAAAPVRRRSGSGCTNG